VAFELGLQKQKRALHDIIGDGFGSLPGFD
jgi:hypothetical protein